MVFKRSVPEWYLAVSPVLTVAASFLILYAFWHFSQISQLKSEQRSRFDSVIGIMSALILTMGISSASPLYSESAVEERQLGRKHLFRLSGLKPLTYWIGMLLADYLLFLITAVLLLVTASFVGLRVY